MTDSFNYTKLVVEKYDLTSEECAVLAFEAERLTNIISSRLAFNRLVKNSVAELKGIRPELIMSCTLAIVLNSFEQVMREKR